jgi:hypothetical protein
MWLRIAISFLAVSVALVAVGSKAGAQCPDLQISFPTPNNVTVTVPTSPPTSVSVPATPGMQIDNSCDGLVVTIPGGATVTVIVNMALVFAVNAKRIELPASMDPLPYEVSLPRGGTIAIKRKQASGEKFDIIVQGVNATYRPKKTVLKSPNIK